MVTASHNGAEDNGVKIIERDGGMLSRDWEDLAEMIINAYELSETIANLNTVWMKGYLFDVNVLSTEVSPNPWPKA
jgi:phosphomannomutase